MKRQIAVLALISFFCAKSAIAGMVLSGNASLISPPSSVVNGSLESNTAMQVFVEKTNFTLTSALSVDITTSGSYLGPASSPGTISAGTVVNSYLFHTDPVGQTSNVFNFIGSANFINGELIIGVIDSYGLLDASDATLGAPSTSYPTGTGVNRGSDEGSNDLRVINASMNQIDLSFFVTSGSVDQLRVITASSAPVPEPASLAMWGLGAIGMMFARRKRQQKKLAA